LIISESESSTKKNDKKLNQLKGNQAISSSDIFGEVEEGNQTLFNII